MHTNKKKQWTAQDMLDMLDEIEELERQRIAAQRHHDALQFIASFRGTPYLEIIQ
jgi:hypothetical protein